jgi:ATP-dependent helicase/nuclease subunit A
MSTAQEQDRAELVPASAGTGKTYALTSRFISLLREGERPDKILATTFTRKAAGEIKSRLFLRLAEEALKDAAVDNKQYNSSSSNLELLERVVRSQHQLKICTLDSFFVGIGRSFAMELGLPLDWQIIEQTEESKLRTEAVSQLLSRQKTGELTTIVQLLNKGYTSRSVHKNIEDEVSALYGLFRQTEPEVWNWLTVPEGCSKEELNSTLQALRDCPPVLTSGGKPSKAIHQELNKAIDAVYSRNWEYFFTKGIGKTLRDGNTTYQRVAFGPEISALYQVLLHHAESRLLHRLKGQTIATLNLLQSFAQVYEAHKEIGGKLRFDDLTYLLQKKLAFDSLSEFYYRLDGEISHILLDEFQDTSIEQWKVLKPMVDEVLAKVGKDYSFFCVGDVKQAIYGWRGGKSQIFDSLKAEYPWLKSRPLKQSWRSAEPIIRLTNAVFSRIAENFAIIDANGKMLSTFQEAARLWSTNFSPHTTHRKDLAGYAALLNVEAAGKADQRVQAIVKQTAALVRDLSLKCPSASIGILVRRNGLIPKLLYALSRKEIGIAASGEGGNPLTDSPAVSAVLALLRLADHPGDTAARYQVAASPLGPIVGLTSHTDGRAAAALSSAMRDRLITHGYGKTLYKLTEGLAPYASQRDLHRLLQLVSMGYAFQLIASTRVTDFVNYAANKPVEDPSAARVRVMTIHKAKGLEFDIVILPELDQPLSSRKQKDILAYYEDPLKPPTRVIRGTNAAVRSLNNDLELMFRQQMITDIKESLSVLYVAITRAVHAVYMVTSPGKKDKITYTKLISAALGGSTESQDTALVHEIGDPDWHLRHPEITKARQDAAVEDLARREIRLPIVKQRKRILVRQAPSGLEGGTVVRLGPRLRLSNPGVLGRGTVIHAFFEQIEWLDNDQPPPVELKRSAALRVPPFQITDALVREFYDMLRWEEIGKVLSKAAYSQFTDEVEVYRELPFAVREGDNILTGSIDRLVICLKNGKPVRAEVLDFKTDHVSSDPGQSIAEKRDFYGPQLDAYRRVAAKIASVDISNVSAKLLFVSCGQVAEC